MTRAFDSARDAGDVRRKNQVGTTGKRRAGSQRSVVEHVERRAAELACPQRRGYRGFVDDAAARSVDQDRVGLHRAMRAASSRFRVAGVRARAAIRHLPQ